MNSTLNGTTMDGWLAGGVGWVFGGTAAAGAKECMYGVDRYY